jgi:hypothetical protein
MCGDEVEDFEPVFDFLQPFFDTLFRFCHVNYAL